MYSLRNDIIVHNCVSRKRLKTLFPQPARHFPEKLAARPFERTNANVDSRVVSAQVDSRVASYTVVDWSMRAFYAMDNLAHVGLKTRSGKMVGETAMEQRPAKRSTKRRR